jgi:hypothetical protein
MKNVILNLTPAEAKVLRSILWNIGGPPAGTRGHADRIQDKLKRQVNKFEEATVNLITNPAQDAIYFLY